MRLPSSHAASPAPRAGPRQPHRPVLLLLFVATFAGCVDKEVAQRAIEAVQMEGAGPEELPAIRDDGEAFRYPPGLYHQKIQGNVTLRIHIDSSGRVVPDSTQVMESSGYDSLDSAAVSGSERVLFEPAKHRGKPTGMSILLPVFFRHPDGDPMPGDTILQRSNPPR